ncbi:response regulator, partial [Bordetella bronchiseptica]
MNLPDILVVEDHPAHRLVVVHALRALGYTRILEAADGNEALRRLDEHGQVGIAICDIKMSGMDGAQFLRVAARRQLLGAVIISSDVSSDLIAAVLDMAALIGLRVLGDLAKPLDAQRLKALLDRHEAERQRARANAAPTASRQPPAP